MRRNGEMITKETLSTTHGGHTLPMKVSTYRVVGHKEVMGKEVQMVVLEKTVEVAKAETERRKSNAGL
jgi:hypothetical protein